MGGCQNKGSFLGTLNNRCRINNRDPKRDHNFDNHPYSTLEKVPFSEACAVRASLPRGRGLRPQPKVARCGGFVASRGFRDQLGVGL